MTNFSTLVYLINNFQNDLDHANFEAFNRNINSSGLKANNKIVSPPESVIKNIMDFAYSYDVLKSESTGYVEMNLN